MKKTKKSKAKVVWTINFVTDRYIHTKRDKSIDV